MVTGEEECEKENMNEKEERERERGERDKGKRDAKREVECSLGGDVRERGGLRGGRGDDGGEKRRSSVRCEADVQAHRCQNI